MSARQPNLRWAPRAALLALLLPFLVECGPTRNEFAPPCPGQAILGDAADLGVYREPNSAAGKRDLTDLVLHGRIVAIQGSCREGARKDQLAVTVSIGVELTRGPAMLGREARVPVFIAVTESDAILDKHAYLMRAEFPSNVDRITLSTGEMDLVLPVATAKSGAAYTIVAGFQLPPDQLERNRPKQ
jgi:hypothetical protein